MRFVSVIFHTPKRSSYPIGSMYGIFPYIYHKNQPNVGKYTIHGWYGYENMTIFCLQIRIGASCVHSCRWVHPSAIIHDAPSSLRLGHLFKFHLRSSCEGLVGPKKRTTKIPWNRMNQERWYCSRWWFQIFFIFISIWGWLPFWLIFFNWVETTN